MRFRRLDLVGVVMIGAIAHVARCAAADVVVELMAVVRGEDRRAAQEAVELLKQYPAERVARLALDAMDEVPEPPPAKLLADSPAARLVRILNDAEQRSEPAAFDQVLIDAWPRATLESTKFVLLYRYGKRRIAGGEPMALATFRDPTTPHGLREHAAMTMARLDWPAHRDELLAAMYASPGFGRYAMSFLLEPGKADPDPVRIAVAVGQLKHLAERPSEAAAAAELATQIGEYSGEHNGVPPGMRGALVAAEQAMSAEARREAAVRRCLEWWNTNNFRFSPQLEAARVRWRQHAATKPTPPRL